MAIIGKETSFCERGVGDSKNNCGAIKATDGGFRVYTSKIDGFKGVVALLQNPLYADKTIAEMNGTYCVYEEGDWGDCPNWTEVILAFVDDIHYSLVN